MDASEATEPFASWTGADDGLVWTVNRAASGYVSTVVDRDMSVLATDDYFEVADDPDLDFANNEDMTLFIAQRGVMPTGATYGLVDKRIGTGASSPGYGLVVSFGSASYEIADGTDNARDLQGSEPADRTAYVLAGRRIANSNVETFTSGVGTGSPDTDDLSNTLSNAEPLEIGRVSTLYYEGEIWAAALFREALTDAEIGLVSGILGNPDALNPYLLHEDALWGWIQSYDGNWDGSDTELVGALNQLNGTDNKEYAEGRGTYLGVPPSD
jgi:hypothetical protein